MYHQIFTLHSNLLKAMAHPHRLEIIHLIRDQEICVSDIHAMLDLPQANVSQHLMILRDAGVVVRRKKGKQIFYKIKYHQIIEACDLIREILIDQNQNSDLSGELNLSLNDLLPLVYDPVCQMKLSPHSANFSHSHYGENYYFCASGCLKKFTESPGKYVRK